MSGLSVGLCGASPVASLQTDVAISKGVTVRRFSVVASKPLEDPGHSLGREGAQLPQSGLGPLCGLRAL